MDWIYDHVENFFGLSHDWALLAVQLGILFTDIILLILLLPWLVNRFQSEFYPREDVRFQSSRGFIQDWHQGGKASLSERQSERQKNLRDAGVDFILEICMNQNIERLVKAPPIAFGFTNVKRVVAARAGYVRHLRSGELYRWIVELHHGRYVYIRGWFDPSRYEVRTSIFTWSVNTAEQAAEIEIRPEILARKGYKETNQNVIIDRDAYQSLLAQIKQGNRDWSGFKED